MIGITRNNKLIVKMTRYKNDELFLTLNIEELSFYERFSLFLSIVFHFINIFQGQVVPFVVKLTRKRVVVI